MNRFNYSEIERISSINKEDFIHKYVKPQKPVVIENFAQNWPAFKKWNFEYIQQVAGNKIVPLYDDSPVDATKKVNEPVQKMPLKEYIDLLKKGPTPLRIFLFNLIKEIPDFRNDFSYPNMGIRFIKSLPMLFFGGENSKVFMHYDIDWANIFHYHFGGDKECVLVSPEQTKYMYKVPYAWIAREDINFDEPDFEKWPALKHITPYKTQLKHGDMLYMPEGYWHYMKYITPGFSMSLRALATKPKNILKAVNNVFLVRNFDNMMRKFKGKKWLEYKDYRAFQNTLKHIQ